jgi:peptidoglycan/LPS O-acetylase OafA/YrhL
MRPDIIGLRQVYALLCSRVAKYLGATSYCIYLVNEPIHKVAGEALSRFAEGDSTLFTVLWIPLAIGLPLAVSAGLHRYLEMPALRWGRDFARRMSLDRGAATVQAPG